MKVLTKLTGTRNDRILKRYRKTAGRIHEEEKALWTAPDSELADRFSRARRSVQASQSPHDSHLVEVFALVKNACRRLLGSRWDVCGESFVWEMVPYDVQILGALALAEGKIAEMATGEGKTLAATMPLAYHALAGESVHLATANDYLARRDSEWMGKIYDMLGLAVGCVQTGMSLVERKNAYQADITYGTGKEFGFDYLRDHAFAHSREELVQRGHGFMIVDEADCLLIDEARTPLIISGMPIQDNGFYDRFKPLIERLIAEQTKACDGFMEEVLRNSPENFTVSGEGVKLFLVSRGDPHNERFVRLMQDYKLAGLVRDAEIHLMRDLRRRRIKETLNAALYYVIEERTRNCYLTEKAHRWLSQNSTETFELPDVVEELRELENQDDLPVHEKHQLEDEIIGRFEGRRQTVHALDNLIKAYTLHHRDVHYCVMGDQVVLVDAFTGRLTPGRRLMDGLHQAIEAKEGLAVSPETQLVATISAQNYFLLYRTLAGMTGTAATSAAEFKDIYKLEVVRIPTHQPVCRKDEPDMFYRTQEEKLRSVLDALIEVHKTGRPVLCGTVSVEKSQELSRRLSEAGVHHDVLNARNHAREAQIISRSGAMGAVTLATNMAGRGTDIRIEKGVEGGLHVIGTERHESRRIDLQLRGRAGRQGDPGSSRFYVSLEDELLKLFGSGKVVKALKLISLPVFKPVARPFIEKLVDFAQKSVELRNYEVRKTLMEFDNVVDTQRRILYEVRRDLLCQEDASAFVTDFLEKSDPEKDWKAVYENALKRLGGRFAMIERMAFLGILDRTWVQHLADLQRLRDGIGFRSFAQTNLITEFRREAYRMFQTMLKAMARAFERTLTVE